MKAETGAASVTPDLLTGKRGRGRPRKADALTGAERQAKYRARHQQIDLGERMTGTVAKLAVEFDLTADQVVRELVRFALCNKNWSRDGFPGVES